MSFDFDIVAQNYETAMKESGQFAVLQKHIIEATKGIRQYYKKVLDAGIGTGLQHDSYSTENYHTTGIEPSTAMASQLRENYPQVDIIETTAEKAEISELKYDLAVFTMVLSWTKSWNKALNNVLAQNPKFLVIANQELTDDEILELGKGHTNQEQIQESFTNISQEELQKFLEDLGYFPLKILQNDINAGILKTVLYTKNPVDNYVYENARYIFQIIDSCNQNCAGCYANQGKNKLDPKKFLSKIHELEEGETIAIRGGEPFLHPRLFEDFVDHALGKKLKVVIDTNAVFMSRKNPEKILEKLKNPNIFLRISFDTAHLEDLFKDKQRQKFLEISQFIKLAEEENTQYSFSCLGMSAEEIEDMIKETPLFKKKEKFLPLTFYSDITDVPLEGKYVNVQGKEFETLVS